MHKHSVGVLGASGYAGRELCALVLGHPGLELAFAAAHAQRGERARLGGRGIVFADLEDAPLGDASVLFSALPHGTSAPWVERARAAGARVVDLSADFRPGSATLLAAARGVAAAKSSPAVPYGLPELARERIRGAELVANPGCYATAILIALMPLAVRGLIPADATIHAAAASGASGAGRAPRADLLFAEVAGDIRPYAADNTHRHLAEMRAVLAAAGCTTDLVFVPHLVPITRGIVATVTVPLTEPLADPLALWRAHYAGESFVEVGADVPSLHDVLHRNVVQLSVHTAAGVRRPTLTIIAAIDNLMKGAAGQALQNANLVLGFDETAGLPA